MSKKPSSKKEIYENKRFLTENEISNILDFITPNKGVPEQVAKSIANYKRSRLYNDLKNIQLYPSLIPQFKQEIEKTYFNTLIQPGESVGIMTAQSIGERQTQQTLNSVEYTTKILYLDGERIIVKQIGEIIDNLMNQSADKVQKFTDQEFLDITGYNFQIPSTDENGFCSWKKIEAVTRHPGDCILVRTESGREVIASLGKSFLTLSQNKLVPTDGSDLKIGDRIPVCCKFPKFTGKITNKLLSNNDSIIKEMLQSHLGLKKLSLNNKVIVKKNLDYYCLLLSKLNIPTFRKDNEIQLNPNISSDHFFNDVYLDKIIEIKPYEKKGNYLYDFTVESTRNFNLFNGLVQRDTFHTTGLSIKTVVTGVPRFTELLNATKEPKARSSQIFFSSDNKNISDLRTLVGNSFTEFKVKHLYKNYKIEEYKKPEDWYEIFDNIYEKDFSHCRFCIVLNINMEKLYEYKLPLYKIANQIEKTYSDLICVFSPNYISGFHIYVDLTDFEIPEDMTEEEAYETHLKDVVIPRLNNIKICGIENIKDIFFEKFKDEWVVETEGSNLQEILCQSKVDKIRTISNDMWEIYNIFGIEAARKFLIEEFKSVISSDGTDVNDSHIILLVDVMTFYGIINSISRYFLKKEKCGPMAKASFEESSENFLKAGLFGEVETTNGVSASVMLGKIPKVGTGSADVIIDIQKLGELNKEILKDIVEENDDCEYY